MPPRTPAAPIVRGSGVEFAPIASRGRGRLDCTFRLGAASRDSATQPRPGEALPLWRCRGGKEGLPAGWGRLWLLVPAGENANSRPFLPPCGCRLAHPSPHLPAAAAQDARKQCGDFAGDSFRFSGNSKESPATGAAPHGSRYTNPQRSGRGPGGRAFSRPPGGFAPLSTRESGLRATKGTTHKMQTAPPHAAQHKAGCVGLACGRGKPLPYMTQLPQSARKLASSSRERGRLTPHQSPSGDSFPSRGSLWVSEPSPHLPAAAAQDARKQCGDFAGDSFRFSGDSKESPATGAAPHGSRYTNPQRSIRGPGGRAFFASPRRLCAAFDGRKRPPSNKRYNKQNANRSPPHAAQPPAGCAGLPAD